MSKPSNDSTVPTRLIHDTCLCLHTQRAARALARRFDEAFRPLGLTSGQFSLLNAMNRETPRSMGEVAAILAMDRTTLTANIKPLERQGLMKITIDTADRRSRRLVLTAAGKKLLRAAAPVWKRTHAALEREAAIDANALRSGLRAIA
ncbi:MAG: MarR family transcriptional regulator [Parvibaculum sp.]|uniref:MarR family winged helix-turn-helix transcriptional regulator n=1 Tax=Parvibaculum sp. TaxID=2024848 RepID=UPI001D35420A|nr:MarR family transcriptional regulator [Parvibaculum sp.]MBX3490779.1 MarR family transcriptional regulator [Parvibaculum sp.]MBX3495972.1 MarR family transcriptional regulator [Parvibaculum sp.]MCW5728683.1 MarR family transcriptional regulator [Parvibaculum sp.]